MRETGTVTTAQGSKQPPLRRGVEPQPNGAIVSAATAELLAGNEHGAASFAQVLRNAPFRSLWIAQICSQLAQNLTWMTLGVYIASLTGKNTLVSLSLVSSISAQFLLSGFAGVLVDRVSKRAVLLSSNILRIIMVVLFILATPLPVALQASVIIVMMFIANSIAQFFAPAEAATIPLLVERRNLIAASSLFNITFNICQVIPITLGLLAYGIVGLVPILLSVGGLYIVAAVLVSTLPPHTAISRHGEMLSSLRAASQHVIGDLRDALHFLSEDPGLRLTIIQINIAPSFLFVFAALGFVFVKETFGLKPEQAWILLIPAGVGLMLGALFAGRIAHYFRKEDLINVGLLAMGTGIAVLGAIAIIVQTFDTTTAHVGRFIARHIHTLPANPINAGLIPPAMLIALFIGLAMSLSNIPAQTLVFERTSEEMRGRVLSIAQLIGGAMPIIPLLVVAPLADLFGTSTVMTGLGIVIVLAGALSVRFNYRLRK